MTHLLQISTSINGDDSLSSALAGEVAQQWQQEYPAGTVSRRDLAANPVPHIDQERFAANTTAPADRTPRQAELAAVADELIAELKAADVVVIGVPMYNFAIPSTLKAYFDHVARAGVTFAYTPNGPKGLLTGKRAVIVATRGGKYAGTPKDTQTEYVKNFLSFLGIDNVEFVYAEGLAMGEESLSASIDAARNQIRELPLKAA